MGELFSKLVANSSYDPTCFKPLFASEDRHFWFRARNEAIATVTAQVISDRGSGYAVLEVGCGTGNVLRILEGSCSQGTVVGMDLFAEGLCYARQRTACPLVQGDMHRPPFGIQFDLVGLFDVLEHMLDDTQVLRDLYTMLKPGGILLLTVPAHPNLWSYFDKASCHCRRYELLELKDCLIRTGYHVEYVTEYMMGLFPVVWLGRRLAVWTKRREVNGTRRIYDLAVNELRIFPVVNSLLVWLLTRESRWIARRRALPLGTSLLAIARKEDVDPAL